MFDEIFLSGYFIFDLYCLFCIWFGVFMALCSWDLGNLSVT